MPDQQPGFRSRTGKSQTIRNIVQAAFQKYQQRLTGNTFDSASLIKGPAELTFHETIDSLDLLLLAQLNTILREFGSALTVFPRRIVASFDGAFIGVTALTF
jgi:hypothetical protein